ncbi:hypothetical protein [Micrococcus flavus]|uniref:hypothetical protein n=1 Tax=Micrococcus flavus TaxID=384602 RepID=UPI001E5BD81A|nr:hypothetical protein [Micrococcus flavus]
MIASTIHQTNHTPSGMKPISSQVVAVPPQNSTSWTTPVSHFPTYMRCTPR